MEIISEAFKRFPGKLAIAFNGGKDNMVLLDLISKYLVAHLDQSVITINLIEEQFAELNEHFEKMVALYKLAPIKLMHLKELKNSQPQIEGIFMGTRRSDPKGAKMEYFSKTTPGWPEYILINPLLDFSYSQVWKYLIDGSIPICSLYYRGYTSLGSPQKTTQNPKLKRENGYLPAWLLENEADERLGRS